MSADKTFPELSETLQEPARRAQALGLFLTHYNSGMKGNPKNGTRIHSSAGPSGRADFFRTPFMRHFRSLNELRAWLDGYEAGRGSVED